MAGGLHAAAVRVVDETVAELFLFSGIHFEFWFSSQVRTLQDFLCVSEMLPFSFVIHIIGLGEAFRERPKTKLLRLSRALHKD